MEWHYLTAGIDHRRDDTAVMEQLCLDGKFTTSICISRMDDLDDGAVDVIADRFRMRSFSAFHGSLGLLDTQNFLEKLDAWILESPIDWYIPISRTMTTRREINFKSSNLSLSKLGGSFFVLFCFVGKGCYFRQCQKEDSSIPYRQRNGVIRQSIRQND